MCLKTGVLDLQGKITLETQKLGDFLVNATTFEPFEPSYLQTLCIDHLKVLHSFRNLLP